MSLASNIVAPGMPQMAGLTIYLREVRPSSTETLY